VPTDVRRIAAKIEASKNLVAFMISPPANEVGRYRSRSAMTLLDPKSPLLLRGCSVQTSNGDPAVRERDD
jgi:hypothetical protein